MKLHITRHDIIGYEPSDLQLLSSRAEVLSIGKIDFALWKSLASSHLQIFSKLFLSFFPNIRHISGLADFRNMFTHRDLPYFPIAIIRKISDMPHRTHIYIACDEYRLLWNSSVVKLIFGLPNIYSS